MAEHPESYQLAKAVTAVTAGGSFLMLSGLILVGTVIGLTVATPLLVIFSPILVPAVITVCMLVAGLVTSGGMGAAAVTVFGWTYKYVKGERAPGSDKIDQARMMVASKAKEMKEYGQQHLPGAQAS